MEIGFTFETIEGPQTCWLPTCKRMALTKVKYNYKIIAWGCCRPHTEKLAEIYWESDKSDNWLRNWVPPVALH